MHKYVVYLRYTNMGVTFRLHSSKTLLRLSDSTYIVRMTHFFMSTLSKNAAIVPVVLLQ